MSKPDLHLVSETDAVSLHFLSVLQRSAIGIIIITAGRDDEIAGVTTASFTLLSVKPPRLLINLNQQSSPFPLIARQGWFGVNMLGSDQLELVDRFSTHSRSNRGYFEGVPWSRGSSGVPLLKHTQAAIECEVNEIIERYARGIIVGRPSVIELSPRPSSLVFWNGQFIEVDSNSDLDLLAEVSIPLAHVR